MATDQTDADPPSLRQHHLGEDRLNREQQRRAQEDRHGIEHEN